MNAVSISDFIGAICSRLRLVNGRYVRIQIDILELFRKGAIQVKG